MSEMERWMPWNEGVATVVIEEVVVVESIGEAEVEEVEVGVEIVVLPEVVGAPVQEGSPLLQSPNRSF